MLLASTLTKLHCSNKQAQRRVGGKRKLDGGKPGSAKKPRTAGNSNSNSSSNSSSSSKASGKAAGSKTKGPSGLIKLGSKHKGKPGAAPVKKKKVLIKSKKLKA
jgi:hypothetical protein